MRATGEKTARDPDWRRTEKLVSVGFLAEEMIHTDGAAASDLYPAKAPEGDGHGGDDPGYNLADDHDLGRVGGYEFLRHFDDCGVLRILTIACEFERGRRSINKVA